MSLVTASGSQTVPLFQSRVQNPVILEMESGSYRHPEGMGR